ncbi:hypothetical protein ACW5WQ_21320 [Aeromonas rivuli]|uniref:hypothetical protein n=1 Tax=Aeromonas rivuli TaxID=648794 RepID=UPI0005A8B5DC|nr:hypothetical protein [Aeromonas rivuli]
MTDRPMPIKDYVAALDYDQLRYLLEVANAKKAAKDDETRRYVHQVVLESGLVANFREEQLAEAVLCLHQCQLALLKSEPVLAKQIYQLRYIKLQSFKECESDYETWFE